MSLKLGNGGAGPWEDRSHLLDQHPNPAAASLHLNADYSVQRFRHPGHEEVDHLVVRRHDGTPVHPGWAVLQRIKDRLTPGGRERFAMEVYPPFDLVVDNCHVWHLWVMPTGWEPGIGLHKRQRGAVHV